MAGGRPERQEQLADEPGASSIDRENLEEVVREHSPWMLAVCRKLLGDAALAEDGVQDALVNAFRKLPQLEETQAIRSWLYRVTLNSCLAILRKRKTFEEELPGGILPEFDENGCRIEPVWARFETPDDLLSRRETRALVLAKIAELPENYRLLIILRDIEELSTAETAGILGLSETNTKVRLHRARSALKRLLEPMLRGDV